MTKDFMVCISLLFLLCASSCKNGGVDPPDDGCSPPPKLDSTSHNFIWRLDTLGEGNGSVLNDVFIINDTLAYAVGEMYLKDSTGQYDPLAYNAATWNGAKWNLRRITVSFRGNQITPPLYGVFAFSTSDIWMSAGVPIRGDGQQWTQYHLFDMGVLTASDGAVRRLWGTSSQNLWFVGDKGTIVWYNGSSWQKLASGTTVDIHDVWGATNPCTGRQEIFAAASYVSQPGPLTILRINQNLTVDTVTWGTGRRVYSLWSGDAKRWYAAGGGVFTRNGEDPWQEVAALPLIFTRGVRGNAWNDVMVVGDFGYIAHYNGSSWYYYTGTSVPSTDGIWFSVSMKGNTAIAVGFLNNGAVIARGVR